MPLPDRRSALLALIAAGLWPATATAQVLPRTRQPRQVRRTGEGRSDAPVRSLSFGPDPLQALDVYGPDRPDAPILLFVHGGGWSRGDRGMVNALPDYAERHGLTLASTDYRLVPAVSAREAAEDVAAGVARLHTEFSGRPIFLIGHSAGAHLAALVGVDPVYLGAHDLAPADLAGVILLDGAGYDATGPRGPGLVGRTLDRMYAQAFGDAAAALSPTRRIRSGSAFPPFLIFHVTSREDSTAQSRRLAETLIEAGGRAEAIAAPGESHRTINTGFGLADDPEGRRAAQFIADNS